VNKTAYHPQCNGLTERLNATLCQLLEIYGNEKQSDWDENIQNALMAYRTSVQASSNITPYEVVFGKQPLLPNHMEYSKITAHKEKFGKSKCSEQREIRSRIREKKNRNW
jgi:hypothetical protein